MENNTSKVGDKLIATNIKPLPNAGSDENGHKIAPPLSVDGEYIVKSVFLCKCGQDHLDVGLVSKYNFISCYKCGYSIDGSDKIHFCHPSRFVKVD
jgi:hypothetical protein